MHAAGSYSSYSHLLAMMTINYDDICIVASDDVILKSYLNEINKRDRFAMSLSRLELDDRQWFCQRRGYWYALGMAKSEIFQTNTLQS